MKFRKYYLFYSIGAIILIGLATFSLKSYSDVLRKEASTELYNYNRSTAIKKMELAQTVWFPLKFNKPYQQALAEFRKIADRAALIIYLKEDYTSPKEVLNKKDLDNFILEIKSINGVSDVKYISKEDALRIYKENNKNEPALIELVTPGILPQYIEVYLNDFSLRDKIEEQAKNKSFVYQVIQSL